MDTRIGRPTKYTDEIGLRICELISTSDITMGDISAMPDMPDRSTIFRWLQTHTDFRDLYVRAREMQTELGYDKMEEIAEAPLPTMDIKDDEGNVIGEAIDAGAAMAEIQRRKLQIDVIKFKLVKLQPKRFGDNKNMNVDVKVKHQLSAEQFAKLLDTAAKADDVEDIEHEEVE